MQCKTGQQQSNGTNHCDLLCFARNLFVAVHPSQTFIVWCSGAGHLRIAINHLDNRWRSYSTHKALTQASLRPKLLLVSSLCLVLVRCFMHALSSVKLQSHWDILDRFFALMLFVLCRPVKRWPGETLCLGFIKATIIESVLTCFSPPSIPEAHCVWYISDATHSSTYR